MAWTFSPDRPIYLQIAERVASEIAGGRYAPGDKFLTVRDLAMEAGVNPNTVQKAMTELENAGLLESRRGDGRYVRPADDRTGALRRRMIAEKTDGYVESMRRLGVADGDIPGTVADYLKGDGRQ